MNFSEIKVVFLKELKEIARDWRTLLITVLFPMLTYPVGLIITSMFLAARQHKDQSSVTRLLIGGPGASAIHHYFDRQPLISAIELGSTTNTAEQLLKEGKVQVLVFAPVELLDEFDEHEITPRINIITDDMKDTSRHAARVQKILNAARLEIVQARLEKAGITGPWARTLQFETENMASSVERSGAWICASLPAALIILILCSTLYPALDLITGERERGTLALLLVTPVKRTSLMFGKVIAVQFVGFLTCVLTVASLILMLNTGLTRMEVGTGSFPFFISPISVLAMIPMAVPLVFLFSALAVLISAYSRNFQQGQGYSTPYVLLVMMLSFVSCVAVKSLPEAIYIVPVANIGVCMGEVLREQFHWLRLLTAFVSSCLYAWYLTRLALQLLAHEEILFKIQVSPERRNDYGVFVVGLYAVCFTGMLYVGQVAQVLDKVMGMIATQFLVILMPAVLLILWLKLPVRDILSLKKMDWRALLGAVLFAPGSVLLTAIVSALQNIILPMPDIYEKMLTEFITPKDVPVALIIFAMAIMPGICEEIMFRGAIFGLLRINSKSVSLCFLVGALFGLFHLSGYRLLSTGMLGVLLTYIVFKKGSIFPAMVFHASHNSLAILITIYKWPVETTPIICAAIVSSFLGAYLMFKNREVVR